MTRLSIHGTLAAALVAITVAGCSAPQVSGTVLLSYDAALAAENAYLASGHVTPAEATKLRAMRVKANIAVQAVVAAEAAGQSSAGVAPLANAAIAAYLAEAQSANGGT
jgi:hypothetical protein